MSYIENGTRVVAISDGKEFKKGQQGVLIRQGGIDSENYYFVQLDNRAQIGPSLADYWEEDKGAITDQSGLSENSKELLEGVAVLTNVVGRQAFVPYVNLQFFASNKQKVGSYGKPTAHKVLFDRTRLQIFETGAIWIVIGIPHEVELDETQRDALIEKLPNITDLASLKLELEVVLKK